jgi:uncharacterized protein RhaS with RHS repeats
MYLSQDPIGLSGNNPTLYGYVKDTNNWLDELGLDSTTLNRKLGGSTGDGLQAHHIIPEEVWGSHRNMFDSIGMEMDSAQNGILLADSDTGRIGRGDAVYHRGSHPGYSSLVKVEVDAIRGRWQPGINDAQMRSELESLQNRLRNDIQNGNVPQSKGTLGCKLG